MTSVLDKLNLSPQERRLVVIVSIIVFVVLNIWLVLPYFGQLGKTQQRTADAKVQIRKYNAEIQKRSAYEKQVKELEGQGNYIPTEEQATALQREVTQQAVLSGVQVQTIVPAGRQSGTRTNTFFEEQAVNLNVQNTGEKELVDFLFSLGAQNTLIRVKNMILRPELPSRMKLGGQITLAKSFQRKPPPKVPTRAVSAPAANTGAKPGVPASTPPPKRSGPSPPVLGQPARQAPQQIPSPAVRTNAPPRPLRPVNK